MVQNTGISITERLTVKRLEMLNKANERFYFRNASMLDGKIYYLAEGCLKPQIFRNWAKVAGFEIWKKSVAWVVFFFCVSYFHCYSFLTSKFVILFSYKRYCTCNILIWFVIFISQPYNIIWLLAKATITIKL